MIKVIITIIVMGAISIAWIIFIITIHFGKNPRNGGIPPRDKMFVKIASLVNGFVLWVKVCLR